MKKKLLIVISVLLVLIAVILWALTLYPGLSVIEYFRDISQLLGLVGFVLLFIQIVLSSKIHCIEKDVGLDNLLSVHRRLGIASFILIAVHPVFLFIQDIVLIGTTSFPPWKLVGIGTFLLLLTAVVVALWYKRWGLSYEMWKNIHRINYAVFTLAFFHSVFLGSDFAGSTPLRLYWYVLGALFVLIIVHHIRKRMYLRRNPYSVTRVVKESHDSWSLYFKGKSIDYKPGQFMIVNLVRDGRTSEPHPFTISSGPGREELSITPKAIGDFTSTIKDTKQGDSALINAPFGVFSCLNYPADRYVFIAGGIGITPFISMLRYMVDNQMRKEVMLLWGNKTEADILFKDELEKMQQAIAGFRCVHVLSQQQDWSGEQGFITTALLKKYVKTFTEGEFFLCGPPVMMRKIVSILQTLEVEPARIHYEAFTF